MVERNRTTKKVFHQFASVKTLATVVLLGWAWLRSNPTYIAYNYLTTFQLPSAIRQARP